MRAECRAIRRRPPLALAVLLLGALAGGAGLSAEAARAAPEEPQALAVLPFRVHSAKPIDYLGESLANLVRSRLEANGEFRVVDPARVAAALAASGGDESDAALRDLAASLGVAYVVSGSLTELGGRYSLDVRTTPAEIGLQSFTQVVTAEGDDELLARVNDIADGVTERVLGAATAIVAQVEVRGTDESLEVEIRARLTTKVGESFDPATVRDDLAMLRSNPAIGSARAETDRGPEGVVVRFDVVLSEQIFATPTPGKAPSIVVEVRIRGNRRIESDAIRVRITTKVGSPYRASVVARDVASIYELGFFRNVRVFRDQSPKGLIVIFDVEENPVVRQISVSGNDHIDGDKIRDILTLTTGSTLDSPLLYENRMRIESLYRAEGYYLAKVEYEIEPLSEASVGIHFIVDEGQKLRLRAIEFVGNEQFSDSELTEDFDTKRWHWWSYATSWFDRSGTYSEPLFLQDLRKVQTKYSDAGYLQVEIGEPDVRAEENGVVVVVTIDEGPRYKVGTLDVAGDPTIDIDTLRDRLTLHEGEWFNRSALTDDVGAITDFYTNRGFYFASVNPLTNLSEQTLEVDVVFQVHKGPLYFVRQIDISGNTTTIDPVIRREVPIVEGQLYSQRQVQLARARVERLGFFEEVDLRMEPTPEPDQLDLAVSVVEQPTGSLSFGAGYSSQDSFVATGSLSQTNLFGRGWGTNVSVDVGGSTQRYFVSFSDPTFLDSDFSFGVTGFRTTVKFEDFDQDQTGFSLNLGHSLSEDNRTRGFANYSFASRTLQEDQNVNSAATIFREILEDPLTSSLIGFSWQTDRRDDRLAPTAGWEAGLAVEYAGMGFFSEFLRFEGQFSYFFGAPSWMPERSTFAFSMRTGYAIPFNSISDYESPFVDGPALLPSDFGDQIRFLKNIDTDSTLPLSERYFLGGLGRYQLRGFKARSVGPRRPILTSSPAIDLNSGMLQKSQSLYRPVGRNDYVYLLPTEPGGSPLSGACNDTQSTQSINQGNGNGKCNDIDDKDLDEFDDLDETDVIGGNSFISASIEYRFPISETIGLQGVLFLDGGNAFAEGDLLFDVTEWRYGTGVGVQWFSPFGPLAVVLGFPLDRYSEIEDSPVFEFSVGGEGF